ncbi:MAG: VOC family protein [Candidatus Eremiobacteraeota bacterium]|nr:VOC family protein [Candidatus Eremiobacteraeota bacterium]
MISSIAFIMYPVTNMQRANEFYRDALGLTEGELSNEHWKEFQIGEGTFGIGDFAQVGTAGTAQSLALEVADLSAFIEDLSRRGIEATEPHDLPFCKISVVHDPDGNQIWLHQSKPR